MNAHKKIANQNWEEAGCSTTRSTNRHGLGRGARRAKVLVNRAAKRGDARWHRASQEVS